MKYIFYFILILYLKPNGISSTTEREAKVYKMHRPSHTQFRHKYCKKLVRIFRRGIGRKLRIYVEKISLDLEEQKEAESDITRIWDTDEEFCVCFIDWQKALTI